MKQHKCDPVLPVRLSLISPALAQSVAVHLQDLFALRRHQLDFNPYETVLAEVILVRTALVGLDSEKTPHHPELGTPDLSNTSFTSTVNIYL